MLVLKLIVTVALVVTFSMSMGSFTIDPAHAAKKNSAEKCEGPRYKFSEVFKRCVRTDDPGF